jgi:hypothetical protein
MAPPAGVEGPHSCPLSYGGNLEVQAGVEPAHDGFANRRVPVSPLHRRGRWLRTIDLRFQRATLYPTELFPHKFNNAKTLGNLPKLKLILVSIPESTAAGIIAVVANAPAFEASVIVASLILQTRQVEWRVLAIDARRARRFHDLEHQADPHKLCQTFMWHSFGTIAMVSVG